jgi:hypothetical protein
MINANTDRTKEEHRVSENEYIHPQNTDVSIVHLYYLYIEHDCVDSWHTQISKGLYKCAVLLRSVLHVLLGPLETCY